ncbi:YczE/YyaS/YitT family protein [Tepidibacter hydrothermalis]|uniref:Membrane protein YczE n=1 Tax=Tepidibacter hydrothermalis TaxID=3036126 RepID=A0ABY8EHR8_9FIRM|nr:hypothetical protein [Tepidibacter hydrothermalis]WFD11134.1 hypothetical protein P4S50_03395 [Tepidibacter hydrothermalis]
MKKCINTIMTLLFGFIVCSIGIILEVNANIGLGPWDAFHIGVIKHIPMSLGNVQIATGLVIVLFTTFMGQIPGWGTISNMILIGIFTDIINNSNIIPVSDNMLQGIIMMVIGIILMAFGTYLYMKVQLGTGPRDGLMVVMVKKTGKSVRFVRNFIEGCALIIGIILGAPVGIGTVIYVFGIGYAVQWIFELFKFDTGDVVHRSILDDYRLVSQSLALKK